MSFYRWNFLPGLVVALISLTSLISSFHAQAQSQSLDDAARENDGYFNDIVPQEELTQPEGIQSPTWPSSPDGTFYKSKRLQGKSLKEAQSRRVQIVAHKSMLERGHQFMEVFVDDELIYRFTISTAWERQAKGKSGRVFQAITPNGVFEPDSYERRRYSNLWKVWLKYVIRFNAGIWIHATTPEHYAELGAPASSGCIRLHEEDAAKLFTLVSQFGMDDVAITVLGAAVGESQKMPKKAPGRIVEEIGRSI